MHKTANLEETEELLLGLLVLLGSWGSFNTLHVVNIGGFVVLAKFGSKAGHGFTGSLAALFTSPVQTFSVAKDGNTLLFLETAARVFLITRSPRLLLRSLNVRIVPALHTTKVIRMG